MIRRLESIKVADILGALLISLLCMQFFAERVSFCATVDNSGAKHVVMALFIAFEFLTSNRRYDDKYEIRIVFNTALLILGITLFYLIMNGYSNAWIEQIYFFLSPIIVTYYLFKDNKSPDRFNWILNLYLYILSSLYTIYIIARIQSGVNLNFSFVDSSSPFENEVAHMFLLLYLYYTYRQDTRKRIVTAILCILAWKRMCLVYLTIVTILNPLISKNRKIGNTAHILTAFLFALAPFFMQVVLSDQFANWFYTEFGIDLIDFLKFRFQSLNAAFDIATINPSHGFGSYIIVNVPWYGSYVVMNMHNDLIRLYLEISFIGLFAMLFGLISITKNIASYLVMLYLFIEMAASHMLGNGGLPFWMLAYSIIYYSNYVLAGNQKPNVASSSNALK